MAITFAILAVTIGLFIWGKPRADVTALLAMLALYLAGIITTGQMLSGFGDSSVIMIGALFIVGEGLTHTGVTAWLGGKLTELSKSRPGLLNFWMMGFGATVSGFMSNTAATAAMMPAVVTAAWRVGSVPGKFLLPLSFAAITGGLLTLTGTPPNVVVTGALTDAGFRPFGFFEFALIGLPLVALLMLYMVTVGQRLLPDRAGGTRPLDLNTSVGELADSYSLHGKLFRLRVRNQSALVGKTLAEAGLGRDYEISVLRVVRRNGRANGDAYSGNGASPLSRVSLQRLLSEDEGDPPDGGTVLRADDTLLVRATPEIVQRAQVDFNFGVQPVDEHKEGLIGTLLSHEIGLAEVLVTPRSELIGKTLAEISFARRYRVHVMGVRRHDQIAKRQRVKLDFGDSLLVRGRWDAIEQLMEDSRNFVVVGRPDALAKQVATISREMWVALAALMLMVALMIAGWTSNVTATLIAASIMVLGGAVPVQQIYRGLNGQSLVLIAAMIPMSVALQVSGGASFLVDLVVRFTQGHPPMVLLAGVFLITSALSQVISNTATTVLVAPLILQTAMSLGVSPYPLMMMVVVGASSAFLTPIGTPTNLLVMGPGGYQFRDYTVVGLPLFALFLVAALFLVPWIWPL